MTRKRLYLETMEEVLGNTSKVIVDTENANNLMYLPLDKLLNDAASAKLPGDGAVDRQIPHRGRRRRRRRRPARVSTGSTADVNARRLFALLAADRGGARLRSPCSRSRVADGDHVPARRDRRIGIQAGAAFHDAVHQQRAQVRHAHPDAGCRPGAVPDGREEERHRGFFRQVAHRGRRPLLHGLGRRRAPGGQRLEQIIKNSMAAEFSTAPSTRRYPANAPR